VRGLKTQGWRLLLSSIFRRTLKGPSGFIVDLLEFSAKEIPHARQRSVSADSRTLFALDGR